MKLGRGIGESMRSRRTSGASLRRDVVVDAVEDVKKEPEDVEYITVSRISSSRSSVFFFSLLFYLFGFLSVCHR